MYNLGSPLIPDVLSSILEMFHLKRKPKIANEGTPQGVDVKMQAKPCYQLFLPVFGNWQEFYPPYDLKVSD